MHWIDPDSLPTVKGKVDCFVLNPHGEVDGFVMRGPKRSDTLVHTPPHMAADLTRSVKVGDEVGVNGVRPREADLLAAVSVTAKTGKKIVDHGPQDDRERPKHERESLEAEGTVRMSLFGPKGELRGALLTDGTSIRVGPKEAKSVAALLAPGASIAVCGEGIQTKYGRVVHAEKIGRDHKRLRPVKAKDRG